MDLDLPREKEDFKGYILRQLNGLDNSRKVKLLEIGYQVDQFGLIKVFVNYDETAEPDGSWTMYLEDNVLERPHWPELCEKFDEDFIIEEIGEAIRLAIIDLRDSGKFDNLNKYEDCQFGIEELNGRYGWPTYADRGKSNNV